MKYPVKKLERGRYLLFILIILGIGIQFVCINCGLGYDDIWSYDSSNHPIGEISNAAPPSRMPLFYITIKGWAGLFGESEYSLKLLQVILASIFLLFMYKIGKILQSHKLGLIIASLTSINPILVHQTHQLDVSLLLLLLSAASFYYLELYIRKEKAIHLAVFSLLCLLSILTQISAVILVLLMLTYLFLVKKELFLKTAYFTFLPLIAASSIITESIKELINERQMLLFAKAAEYSFMPYQSWNLLFVPLGILALYGVICNKCQTKKEEEKIMLISILGIGGLISGLVASLFIRLTYEHVIFFFVFLLISISFAVNSLKGKVKIAIISLIILLSLFINYTYLSALPEYGWKEASLFIKNNANSQDLILGSCYAKRPLLYYSNISIDSIYNLHNLPNADSHEVIWAIYSQDYDCLWNLKYNETMNGLSYLDKQCYNKEKREIKKVIITRYSDCNYKII
jgi:4-amino-4-deoxy-L-arabinose transferase-like glycosyltransferase